MKPVVYTRHAEERMQERGVTSEQVEAAIRDPHTTLPDGKSLKVKYIGLVNGRNLKVVVDPTGPENVVVTVAWS